MQKDVLRLVTKSWLQQFRPFSRSRRDAECCLITNGYPKSGTYFLHRIIEGLDRWEDIRIHIIPDNFYTRPQQSDFVFTPCLAPYSVKKLRNGQCAPAHLPYSSHLENVIGNVSATRRIKHLFLYRDPRDALVSYMRFITYSPSYTRTQEARTRQAYMQEQFANDAERLSAVIRERLAFQSQTHYRAAKYAWLQYEPWLHSPHCCALGFEDVYNEFLTIKEQGFGRIFKKLLEYLELDADDIDPVRLYEYVNEKGVTASGETQKIGQYTRYFTEEHYSLLDTAEFRKILDAFGYAW